MAKLIHSMVRVLDETRSVNFYKQAFNLDVAERFEFETFTLIYLSNSQGDFELELTVNKGREVPYALGDGYGHLAVSVEDVDAEHARLSELGLSVGRSSRRITKACRSPNISSSAIRTATKSKCCSAAIASSRQLTGDGSPWQRLA